MNKIEKSLFRDEEFEEVKLAPEKVVCLGMEFESDDARRTYFREELRKKLSELRQIEGFPIGEDEDIIKLSDPPYYTACPNPWLNDFIAEWEKEKVELEKQGKRKAEFEVKEPYASDVSEGKNNPIYTVHTYHTKVPHPAIMRYILHYTQPGDIVLDGFGGTGMTGLAAQACADQHSPFAQKIESEWKANTGEMPKWGERHAICGDLSPYASNISYFYNSPFDAKEFKKEVDRIYEQMEEDCGWLYEVRDENGKIEGRLNFAVWSDIFVCPLCGEEYVFWDAAVDYDNKCMLDEFPCPHCRAMQSKKTAQVAMESHYDEKLGIVKNRAKCVPVIIVYKKGKKQIERRINQYDLELINKIESTHIVDFYPIEKLPKGSETMRNLGRGIDSSFQFYTKRNLLALSHLYSLISHSSLSQKLRFLFTGLLQRSTIMNRVHMKYYFYGGGGWNAGFLKGTMYIPNAPIETSVIEQIQDKASTILNAYPFLPKERGNSQYVGSASQINIADNSVDYIFIDPPFGANINYSELNSLPEPWLKVVTNNATEAIDNKAQGKDRHFYHRAMQNCFAEYFRILKPDKWMTVEFSNTSAAVWNSIQTAIQSVGFVIVNVSALDKKQGSFNAVTTTTAVKQDLVITCFKPSNSLTNSLVNGNLEQNVWSFMEELLQHLPIHLEKGLKTTAVVERNPKILFDRMISYFVQHGLPVPMNSSEFQRGLRDRFIERDGMFFTASQAVEYEKKKSKTEGIVPMALFIGSEAEGIEWLKRKLETPQTYQELQPDWMKDLVATKKGDVMPELMDILEENFIKDEDGKWRKPDAEKAADLEIIRGKKLMKEFNLYLEQAQKPRAKRMKDSRLEVLRYGFKECYKQKDYQAIITVGDHIQESLLQEDEVLLQYYDIASMRV